MFFLESRFLPQNGEESEREDQYQRSTPCEEPDRDGQIAATLQSMREGLIRQAECRRRPGEGDDGQEPWRTSGQAGLTSRVATNTFAPSVVCASIS